MRLCGKAPIHENTRWRGTLMALPMEIQKTQEDMQ